MFSLCCTVATLLAERIAERFVSGPTGIAWSMDTATATRSLVLVTAALVVAAWLNYRRQRPFESAAAWLIPVALLAALALSGLFDRDGVWAPFDPGVNWRLAPVSLLITLALMVLAALALTVSTFAPPAPTVAITVAVFAAGLAVDYYLGQPHPGHARWLALAPNWQHFWLADAINNGGGIAGTYVARAAAYALLQTLGWLALGVAAFRHAEVGRRE